MDRYMSVGDVSKVLGVVPATVKLMVRDGRLKPAARTFGGIQLFDPKDVEKMAVDREERGTKAPGLTARVDNENSGDMEK